MRIGRLGALGAFVFTCGTTEFALAGGGSLEDLATRGQIHLTVALADAGVVAASGVVVPELQAHFQGASDLLWDATDGQLSIGSVSLVDGPIEARLADVYVYEGTSGSRASATLSAIGRRGGFIRLFHNALVAERTAGENALGYTVAHEIAHYALGLGDEYREDNLCSTEDVVCSDVSGSSSGATLPGETDCPIDLDPDVGGGGGGPLGDPDCPPVTVPGPGGTEPDCDESWADCFPPAEEGISKGGPCLDHLESIPAMHPEAPTERHHCIMQRGYYGPRSASSPATEFCVEAHHDPIQGCDGTEDGTTMQTCLHGESCWSTLAAFPFISPPGGDGLPIASVSTPSPPVNFTVALGADTRVVLVLDESGSMDWNANSAGGPICGLTTPDPPDCTLRRIEYLRQGVGTFLDLVETTGSVVQVSVLPFASVPGMETPPGTLPAIRGTVDALVAGLTPAGGTAIGDALEAAANIDFAGEPPDLILLYTDGEQTAGTLSPSAGAAYARSREATVFTIGTNESRDGPDSSGVAASGGGTSLSSASATDAVNLFARQWAATGQVTTIIPRLGFRTTVPGTGGASSIYVPPHAGLTDRAVVSSAGTEVFQTSFHTTADASGLVVVLGDLARHPDPQGVELTLYAPDGSLWHSSAPSSGMTISQGMAYTVLRLAAPMAGEWVLELRSGPGALANQQEGTLAVFTQDTSSRLELDVEPRVPSLGEPVVFTITPSHGAEIRELDSASVAVREPDGDDMVLPMLWKDGRLRAELASVNLQGAYRVSVQVGTGQASYLDPGEDLSFSAQGPPQLIPAPTLQLGAKQSFHVVP